MFRTAYFLRPIESWKEPWLFFSLSPEGSFETTLHKVSRLRVHKPPSLLGGCLLVRLCK